MHLLRQIFWLKAALVAFIVFAVLFVVVFEQGIGTVRDAEKWNAHTGDALDAIASAQEAGEAALNAGRLRLVGQSVDVEAPRQKAFELVQAARRSTIDNEAQTRNADDLERLLQKRFELQDQQMSTAVRQNGSITLNAESTIENTTVAYQVENAFTRLRMTELALLQSRDSERTAKQWRVIYGMRLFFILMIGAIVTTLVLLIREATARRTIADRVRESNGIIDAPALLKLIEEGEKAAQAPFVALI